MGSRLVKYEFSPKENEQIEAIIKVPEETRSVIHGVVIDCRHRPIKDAVVKLLEVLPGNPCRMKPLTHTFTDSCGQFLFGPLYCNKKYALKVWYSDVKIRELIISPDCDDYCDEHYDDDHYDDEHSDDYRDGHYSGYTDINFEDYFGRHSDDDSDDQCENSCENQYDDHCNDHDYNNDQIHNDQIKDDSRREQRRDERRRDRHSDDDNYIHYKAPKVYGQKCTKCEIGKKVNNFEDIEK